MATVCNHRAGMLSSCCQGQLVCQRLVRMGWCRDKTVIYDPRGECVIPQAVSRCRSLRTPFWEPVHTSTIEGPRAIP